MPCRHVADHVIRWIELPFQIDMKICRRVTMISVQLVKLRKPIDRKKRVDDNFSMLCRSVDSAAVLLGLSSFRRVR